MADVEAPGEPPNISGAQGSLPDADAAKDTARRKSGYTTALISEIRLLTRAISNDPGRRLNDLSMTYQFAGETMPTKLSLSLVINRIADIEGDEAKRASTAEIGFLQAVRDVLVGTTAPATGETIAYTTLVTGGQRNLDVESSFELAQAAYGLLQPLAHRHLWAIRLLTVVAVVATLFAACEATRAALGKSLLQNLDLLRSQQAVIASEKLKLETSMDPQFKAPEVLTELVKSDAVIPTYLVPLCDRYRVRAAVLKPLVDKTPLDRKRSDDPGSEKGGATFDLQLQMTPQERELCGRDTVLATNLSIAHSNLQAYLQSWPGMAGGLFTPIEWIFGKRPPRDLCPSPDAGATDGGNSAAEGRGQTVNSRKCADIEFVVAPILQVITNYTLPLLFGFIGSVLYVLLDHFTKMRTNTLSPKDFPLMGLRLILGLVIAACVSLLISSYAGPGPGATGPAEGLPSPGSLVATLTLSAAGVAFLAGFGAEAVFILLQNLVQRVFAVPKS